MSTGLIQRLALATALFATGAILFVLADGIPARRPPVVVATPVPVVDDAAPTLLPTVVVHADADDAIPTLATIVVRAPRLDRGRTVVASADAHVPAVGNGGSGCSSSMTRCAGLEMPYYSFGKTLRSFRE